MEIGAKYLKNRNGEFSVWAPLLHEVALKILSPEERLIAMTKDRRGYWHAKVENVSPETTYFYVLEGEKERPDPASFFQPHGVHKESQLVDHNSFQWHDSDWNGLALHEMILYELHVGVFTTAGTFDAIIPRLDELRDMGVNAIELMPVAQFPGERNWGYDGVYPFAVQNSYGGPEGLKRLVNECHKKMMAVILDVVYNHLGPEGNYLWDYGPYFTDRYKTPWGQAINFDGPHSNEVRNFFIENALFWFKHYHVDALRLDAIHGIFDMSARPFLLELVERAEDFSRQQEKKLYLIAESDLNNAMAARQRDHGGYGLDALWCDDFHHALHTLLTGENQGYYIDFGGIEHLVKSLKEGFVYSGEYSRFRKRSHGNSSRDIPAERFIVFSQNHDQIGNRMQGERLHRLVSFESQKLAAGMVLLSPYIPLIFMGEEYGETAPFLYFISFSDPHLTEGVRQGRKREFQSFNWREEPPDPHRIETFTGSKINWEKRNGGAHSILLNFHKEVIRVRKDIPALKNLSKECLDVRSGRDQRVLFMRRWKDNNHIVAIFNFDSADITLKPALMGLDLKKILDSSEKIWNGPGALLPDHIKNGEAYRMRGESFALYSGDSLTKNGSDWALYSDVRDY